MTTSEATITIEDTITGHIETVSRNAVAETISAWYVGDVPEVLEVAIEKLQDAINDGDPLDAMETYLGINVTV